MAPLVVGPYINTQTALRYTNRAGNSGERAGLVRWLNTFSSLLHRAASPQTTQRCDEATPVSRRSVYFSSCIDQLVQLAKKHPLGARVVGHLNCRQPHRVGSMVKSASSDCFDSCSNETALRHRTRGHEARRRQEGTEDFKPCTLAARLEKGEPNTTSPT